MRFSTSLQEIFSPEIDAPLRGNRAAQECGLGSFPNHLEEGWPVLWDAHQLGLVRRGQFQAKSDGWIGCSVRVSMPVAQLEGERLAIELRVEQRFGDSGRRRWRLTLILPDQIKQDGALQRAGFLGDVQCRSGQVVPRALPDADNSRIPCFMVCPDDNGKAQQRDASHSGPSLEL